MHSRQQNTFQRRKMKGSCRKCTFSLYCNVFCCLLCIFNCQTTPVLKTLGQFENLVFAIMPTRENILLIARTSLPIRGSFN